MELNSRKRLILTAALTYLKANLDDANEALAGTVRAGGGLIGARGLSGPKIDEDEMEALVAAVLSDGGKTAKAKTTLDRFENLAVFVDEQHPDHIDYRTQEWSDKTVLGILWRFFHHFRMTDVVTKYLNEVAQQDEDDWKGQALADDNDPRQWEEDDTYSRSAWKEDIELGETQLGYWEWVGKRQYQADHPDQDDNQE